MDYKLTDDQIAQRSEYFKVCQDLEKRKPEDFTGFDSAFSSDEGWGYHRYCAKEFAKRGWLSLGWPPEYGGSGTIMDRVLLAEAKGYHNILGVDPFGVGMLAPTLLQAASEDIKNAFLPPIAAAEVAWCELWSEPNAGSDLASLTSTAIRDGDEYVINGQKIWTTGAHRADWGFGLFKSDPTGRKNHNLSFLLIDMKTPGITVRPLHYMTMNHVYNEVFFDNVRVPAKNIVGQEHEGWAVTLVLASFERSNMDEIMAMRRRLEGLVTWCNETKRAGKPLSKDPVIRNKLAQIACDIEAAHALAYQVADLQSRKEMALMDASAIKIFAGELTERLALLGSDLLGSYGQVKLSRWAPLDGFWVENYQECLGITISAGSNEIQKNIIAWRGLGLPRTS